MKAGNCFYLWQKRYPLFFGTHLRGKSVSRFILPITSVEGRGLPMG